MKKLRIIIPGFTICIAFMVAIMSMGAKNKKVADAETLLAATTLDAATTLYGATVILPDNIYAVIFILDVTDANSAVGDKLDIYVQTKLDNANWLDVYHFTQCDGNGGAKRYIGKIEITTAVTEFEAAAALGESTGRDLIGDYWRVKYVGTETDAISYNFSVTALPIGHFGRGWK